jgi:outer membrane protein assembly factor BamB
VKRVTPLVLFAALLTGCTAAAATATDPTASPSAPSTTATASGVPTPEAVADWTTYHHDNARTGAANVPAPRDPHVDWHATLDGAVYGQPLVVGGKILAATENDTVYALDAATGKVLWSTHLGTPVPRADLPCGDIDPLGITGTMVFDPASSRVFAVAESTGGLHTLAGIDLNTGALQVRVGVDPPAGDRIAHQQRAALTLLHGRVFVAYGGLAGDCANYIGSVVSVTTAGRDPLHYQIPTGREGGIWTPGGATVDGQSLLYSVGNGESTDGGYDGSDSVIALSDQLRRTDFFAPGTWADDNANDRDLGSGSPTVLGDWVFIAGKRGVGYVLRSGHLGGINGQVAQTDACASFGGSAVAAGTAYLPCPNGPIAVTIDATGKPTIRWHATVTANGAPVVGGGAVWVTDYKAGALYALRTTDGAVLAQLPVGDLPHFASPTLSGTHAYLGTMTGVSAIAID